MLISSATVAFPPAIILSDARQSPRYTVQTIGERLDDIADILAQQFPQVAEKKAARAQWNTPSATGSSDGDVSQILAVAKGYAVGTVSPPAHSGVFSPSEVLRTADLYRPVLWQYDRSQTPPMPTSPTFLPLPPETNRAIAVDVNDSGTILGQAGWTTKATTPQKGASIITYGMTNNGTSSWTYIYDSHPVAGVWAADHRWLPLSPLSGYARVVPCGLNNPGDIIGWCIDRKYIAVATIWRHGDPINLNECVSLPQGDHLVKAIYINDAGAIVAGCEDAERHYRLVLLTPALASK